MHDKIALTHYDFDILDSWRDILQKEPELYGKMKVILDCKHDRGIGGLVGLEAFDKKIVMIGAALMHQLMTNPEFLKDVKQEEYASH